MRFTKLGFVIKYTVPGKVSRSFIADAQAVFCINTIQGSPGRVETAVESIAVINPAIGSECQLFGYFGW